MSTDPWTPDDDSTLVAALALLEAPEDVGWLAGPEEVRARGEVIRRRRTLWRGAAAAAVVVVLGGAAAVAGLRDGTDRTLPAGPTSTSTPTPSPSPPDPATPAPSPSSTPTPQGSSTPAVPPEPEVVRDTRVIGEDGAVGPFRLGMTEAEVRAAIEEAGLSDEVRLETSDPGGVARRVLVQDGLRPDDGSAWRLGSFDDGALTLLFPPPGSRIRGLGEGDSVAAFEKAFPGRVSASEEASSVHLVRLREGTRLQLGSGAAVNDPESVAGLVILPSGRGIFFEFG